MKNFENKIREIFQEDVDAFDKTNMKSRLMKDISSNDPLWARIKQSIADVKLSVHGKAIMKEKLFAIVEGQRSWFDDFVSMFSVRRLIPKAVASVSAFALLFVMIIQPFTSVGIVSASSFTRIVGFEGEVFVERAGLKVAVDKEMGLQEGDKVVTGEGASAEIIYADDSISRLNESTKVSYTLLDDDTVNTHIDMEVIEGQVWNNVVGLVGEDAFFAVTADNLKAKVTDKSTFDIEVTDSYTRVVTLDNAVNLTLKRLNEVIPATLSKGKLVKVKKKTPYLSYLDTLSFNERLSEFDLDWYQDNLLNDKIYISNLEDEIYKIRRKEAGITPDSPLYPVKDLGRKARLALTVDPVKKEKVKLNIANQQLLEAEVLIAKGENDTAKELLDNFEETVVGVAGRVDEIKEESFEKAEELSEDLKKSVKTHKKSLKNVLPNSDVYEVKRAVKNVEVKIASDESEKQKVELKQAQESVIEAKELIENKEDVLAKESIDEYVKKVDGIVEDVDDLSEDERKEVISNLVDSKVTTLGSLESVDSQEDDENDDELKASLEEARQVSLDGLREAVTKTTDEEVQAMGNLVTEDTFSLKVNKPEAYMEKVEIPDVEDGVLKSAEERVLDVMISE